MFLSRQSLSDALRANLTALIVLLVPTRLVLGKEASSEHLAFSAGTSSGALMPAMSAALAPPAVSMLEAAASDAAAAPAAHAAAILEWEYMQKPRMAAVHPMDTLGVICLLSPVAPSDRLSHQFSWDPTPSWHT